MDKSNKEKLIPAIITSKKFEEKKEFQPEFKGTICVNQIFTKPKDDPFDIQLAAFSSGPKDKISKRKFSSYKQEQHFRLNRESKLKVNEQISHYIKNTKKHAENTTKNRNLKKKSETEQIKDATKQIAEINQILECRRTLKVGETKKKNIEDESLGVKQRVKQKKMPVSSNMKHTCTKNLANRLNNYHSIIEDFEKKLKLEPKVKQTNKYCFSTPEIITPCVSTSKKNSKNKKAIDAIYTRIIKSKEKLFNESFEKEANVISFKTEKSKEPDYINRNKKPTKYKSLKDVKLDEDKLKQFQEEVKTSLKMMDDPKETHVLYENEIFKKTNNVLQEEYYKDYKVINERPASYKAMNSLQETRAKSYQKQRVESPIEKNRKQFLVDNCNPHSSVEETEFIKSLLDGPKKEEQLLFKRNPSPRTPKTPKTPKQSMRTKYISPETKFDEKESKTVGVSTNYEPVSELEKSILKSDYLMKEFHINHNIYPVLNKEQETKEKKKEETIAVNWADKFKIQPPKKWPREMEYLMS